MEGVAPSTPGDDPGATTFGTFLVNATRNRRRRSDALHQCIPRRESLPHGSLPKLALMGCRPRGEWRRASQKGRKGRDRGSRRGLGEAAYNRAPAGFSSGGRAAAAACAQPTERAASPTRRRASADRGVPASSAARNAAPAIGGAGCATRLKGWPVFARAERNASR